MMTVDGSAVVSGKSMLVVLCLAAGTIVGELIGIEKGFEKFGEWLKEKTGNSGDKEFVNAFVTASLTVCIGAMAIVGAIQDGIMGDYSTLAVKAVPVLTRCQNASIMQNDTKSEWINGE